MKVGTLVHTWAGLHIREVLTANPSNSKSGV